MKYLVVLFAVLFSGIVVPINGPATAADLGAMRSAASHGYASSLPFPRSARAAAVWGEGACWHDCQAQCTWELTGCLSVDSQGRCVKYTDACDRSCQRDCRVRGGPYVSPLFDELD